MRRYIDADLLLAQCRRNPLFERTEKDKGMIYIERSIIDDTPTADVVEVVRCKDCRNSRESYDEEIWFCMHFADTVDSESFCSYGERKDDGLPKGI